MLYSVLVHALLSKQCHVSEVSYMCYKYSVTIYFAALVHAQVGFVLSLAVYWTVSLQTPQQVANFSWFFSIVHVI